MYIPDLAERVDLEHGGTGVAVGWLSREHAFPTGDVTAEFTEALKRCAIRLRHQTRGFHDCEFCDVESPIFLPVPEAFRGQLMLGTAEIYVAGEAGEVYAAPNLVLHYVVAHRYLPPQPFVDAVLRRPSARHLGEAKVDFAHGMVEVHTDAYGPVVRVPVPEGYGGTEVHVWDGLDSGVAGAAVGKSPVRGEVLRVASAGDTVLTVPLGGAREVRAVVDRLHMTQRVDLHLA